MARGECVVLNKLENMFFAPPTLKSLSKYEDFGVYLEYKYFLIMLGAAILMHGGIIDIIR